MALVKDTYYLGTPLGEWAPLEEDKRTTQTKSVLAEQEKVSSVAVAAVMADCIANKEL